MSKNLSYFKKTAEIFLALIAIFLLVVSVAVFFAFWKLSSGPVDVTWAQKYIQNALGDDENGIQIDVGGIVAEWKSFDSPVLLGISNLSITEKNEKILNVSQAGLRLSKAPLFLGIVSPEAIFIKGPTIRFEKSETGQLSFLIGDQEKDPGPKTRMTPQEIGDSLFLGGLLNNKSRLPLSRLQSFVIEDAVLIIDDKSEGQMFSMPQADLTLNRDTDNVNLVMNYNNKHGEVSKINAVITRNALQDQIKFLLKLQKVETELWTLHLPKLPGLMKKDYSFDGQITGFFDTEWTLKSLSGDITTAKDDVEGQGFGISALRDPKTGIIPIKLALDEIGLDQIAAVWPEELAHLNVTDWFTRRLSKGVIKNLELSVPFMNQNGKWTPTGEVTGGLNFENLTCDYRAPLYPITEGYGRAVIADNKLVITIDKAKLDNMDIKGGSVTITELTGDAHGEAIVDLKLQGALSTVFKYITLEPISLGEKIKMDPSKVGGQGDINVLVTFPTIKDLPADQVKAVVDAKLTDAILPGIVRGLDLTGGPFDLKVKDGMFSIAGKGALDGNDIDFAYSEYLNTTDAPYAADLKAKLVSTDALRQKLGIDITDYISGKAPLDLVYQEKTNGITEIDVKADLTPSQTFVKPFNYLKKEGIAGQATAKLFLKDKTIQKIQDLNVTIGNDRATNGQLAFGMVGKENNVTSATFDSVKLGEANDFALKITQDASTLKVTATGKSIDARAFLGDKPEEENAEPRSRDVALTIKTNTMRMGDAANQVIGSPVMTALINPDGQVKNLDLKGGVGTGSLSLKLAPSSQGVMNLQADSDNAGAALYVLGAYDNMVGGTLAVSGAQIAGGGINDIQGAALISDFKVVKAPALAQLIGAFSITGLPELLANDGISFSKLKTNFIWRQTRRGNRIINFYDGATSGGSVGLTFGGVINQTQDTIDISGTFVPISQINRVVSAIPIVGQLLTGGKNGGIIAATYSLKGPSSNPSVRVNPLSVLAPGFLRSILFEGGLNSGRDEKPIQPRNRRPAAAPAN